MLGDILQGFQNDLSSNPADIVRTVTSVPNGPGGQQGTARSPGGDWTTSDSLSKEAKSRDGLLWLRPRVLWDETVLFAGRGGLQACEGTARGDAGRGRTVGNRGAVCNGGNDRTEVFCGVKRSGSSEREYSCGSG